VGWDDKIATDSSTPGNLRSLSATEDHEEAPSRPDPTATSRSASLARSSHTPARCASGWPKALTRAAAAWSTLTRARTFASPSS